MKYGCGKSKLIAAVLSVISKYVYNRSILVDEEVFREIIVVNKAFASSSPMVETKYLSSLYSTQISCIVHPETWGGSSPT